MVYNAYQRQGGVALIMAVVVVAIIALLAVAMSSEQNLLVRRIQNTVLLDTAWQCALGGEQYAVVLLKKKFDEDKKKNKAYDNLKEFYPLGQAAPIPLPNSPCVVAAGAKMTDLQSRFNLSNLNGQNNNIDATAVAALSNLLNSVGIPQTLGNSISAAISDWIDSDDQELANGAEDSYYQTLEQPYLTANQMFKSVEELRLVKGMQEEVPQPDGTIKTAFDLIKDHVILLPERSALNVNTADQEVLQAYIKDLGAKSLDIQEKTESDEPYETVDAFKNDPVHQNWLSKKQGQDKWADVPEIGVRSEYFSVELTVSLGGTETPLYSVLKRDINDGKVHVVRRQRGKN